MTNDSRDSEPLPVNGGDDADIIGQALQMLNVLDNTPLNEMNPLFYQHWFEQLNMTIRDLLRTMGHDPGA